MGTEKQDQPENPDRQGSEGRWLIGHTGANQGPSQEQAKQPAHSKHNRFADFPKYFARPMLRITRALWSILCGYKTKSILTNPMVWLEIAALIALFFYTRYAGEQRDAMNNTLIEIRKQTGFAGASAKAAVDAVRAAQDGLTRARDNSRLDQRAWVGVKAFATGTQRRRGAVNLTPGVARR